MLKLENNNPDKKWQKGVKANILGKITHAKLIKYKLNGLV